MTINASLLSTNSFNVRPPTPPPLAGVLLRPSTLMATAKIKIAARLRPMLPGEMDDDSVKVCHDWDGAGTSSSGGGSFMSVTNPRDTSQVFKFPYGPSDSSFTRRILIPRAA